MKLIKLTDEAYIYTSYGLSDGFAYPANGMYLLTQAGAVLFDTPWDTTRFQPLLDSIQTKHNQKVVLVISTHFHADRTAGLEYYSSQGIPTYTSKQTHKLCLENDEKKSEFIFTQDTTFQVGNFSIETFYPGEGHSPDNIVLWVPQLKILYGGCFVKSVEVKGLGNLSHANPKAWESSVWNVIDKYPDRLYTIPGHYGWEGKDPLSHTLKLIQKYLKKYHAN